MHIIKKKKPEKITGGQDVVYDFRDIMLLAIASRC